MTSGALVPLQMFGIWDRVRHLALSPYSMYLFTILVLLSLTHGYLPYGSSDILVPSLVGVGYALELLPRYGGVVDSVEYLYSLKGLLGLVCGILLPAVDIKRKNSTIRNRLMMAYYAAVAVIGAVIGFKDRGIMIAILTGVWIYLYPIYGHLCWHLASSYSLFIWWYMLRVRPGDTATSANADTQWFTLLLLLGIKNSVRRIMMNLPAKMFPTSEARDRALFLLEHIFFTLWSLDIIVRSTPREESWFFHPNLCWTGQPVPSEQFHLYYSAKVTTHIEDLLYMIVMQTTVSPSVQTIYSYFVKGDKVSSSSSAVPNAHEGDPVRRRDVSMDVHHVVTAFLCIISFYTGYLKIGSLVMLLHDASDVPLDLLRLLMSFGSHKQYPIAAYVLTVLSWMHWRLWIFPAVVMYTILVDSKSLLFPCPWDNGTASYHWLELAERIPFLLVRSILLCLHAMWFVKLLRKGFKELSSFGRDRN